MYSHFTVRKPVIALTCIILSLVQLRTLSAQQSSFVHQSLATTSTQDAMNSRLLQLEAEVRQLRSGQIQQTGADDFAAETAATLLPESNIELAGHELYCETDVDTCFSHPQSKFPTFIVSGFFHADLVGFNQDNLNKTTVGDLENGGDFRRARVAFKGNVTEDISYIMEFDFAETIPLFADVWVNFTHVPGLGNIRIGRWRQPFGMSELTSIRELPFLERSTLFTFTPFRQTGVGFFNHNADESATWALSGFRYPSNGFGNNVGDGGGWGLSGRATLLPVYNNHGEELVHLGANYMYTEPSMDVLRFASQPEIQVAQTTGGLLPAPLTAVPFFVNTGAMSVQNTNTFGLELAGAIGGVYLQSEARWAMVNMLDGSSETFPGAYAQARYILTEEKLPYNKSGGVFGRVVPDEAFSFSGGGLGAWELAARWSYIDLNGANLAGPGRRLNDLTFGLNWYLNKFTKFQFNYIHAFLDDPVLGKSDADVAAVRAQLDF